MTATLSGVKSVLEKRTSKLMAAVDLDAQTFDIDDPLAYAMRKMGYSVASVGVVTSSEVTTVPDSDVNQLLDLAELRLLETLYNEVLTLVTVSFGSRSQQLSDMSLRLRLTIDGKRKALEREYGDGLPELEAGVIDLYFGEAND